MVSARSRAATPVPAPARPPGWPAAHDPAAAARLVERFAALGRAEAKLATRPDVVAVLDAIGGNSPFLADLVLREPGALRGVLADGPEAVVAAAMAALAAVAPAAPRPVVAAALRRAKRVVALAVALADLGSLWPLGRVTAALSDLAQATLTLAVAHLLRAAHTGGTLALPDPDRPAEASGLVVLGMGKLGARELNYSSDIDLILIYDPAAPIYTPRGDGDAPPDAHAGGVMSRLARDLVGLMEARDADGYVFRTDLRLRPDPAATPPAIALPAAIAYYESMGQNWERAAMIKARPVAGDLAAGQAFLDAIRPFVWRRGLDFALIADIHAMKRRIDVHRGGGARAPAADPVARVAGVNVKLSPGGIREIEFLAQTLALVWGGRDPTLRPPTTLGALAALARAGLLARRAARELAADYGFLRRVEHRLQMVADRQVHSLPARAEDVAAFATFMGYADPAGFARDLAATLDRVRAHYAAVFERIPDPLGPASRVGEIDLSGDDPAPADTVAALTALGFAEPVRLIATLRGWLAGRVRALRSERARELMARLLPALLDALARQPQPDAAFARCDQFLARLPAGVPILSLFERHPALIERLAAILGAAPSLAEHLASHPAALDALLGDADAPADPARLLRARLADATGLEDAILITRRTVREEDFAISAATLEARIDADAAGLRRAALADAALAALLAPVLADFARRYGRVRGGALAVVVLGKAGGREMMAGSDLDLMLIYDHPEGVTESARGPRALPAGQYFARAAHAYVAALTAPGADGQMYAVDMRLRPSGNKGPVAVSLPAFRRYHAEAAWTWERMALTRARVVAGPAGLRAKVAAAIAQAVAGAGPPERIRADAAAMRARLARDLPPAGPWDVKLRPGGQIEVEFIGQTLQLIAAVSGRAGLCHPTLREALARLAGGGLLPAADAAALVRADLLWRSVQGMLRITVGRAPPLGLPEASARALLRAVAGVVAPPGLPPLDVPPLDLPALRATLDATAAAVRAIFVRLIGEIAP
ncbi:MAG: bifunctional [glutamine synthetase] adenylyltransferase/[glutamine synthetase]-adenylyl-L-tyrosine phosphorylase [Proteobacteria bacterium]|nr:bifunctional [glutamine synthetase] adenylyltransferase/[glutamine synthetase]-adenylyl-L-tyrosine phosphorylase [Pseudomonadota bacterium]